MQATNIQPFGSYATQETSRSFLCNQMPVSEHFSQANKQCDLEATISDISQRIEPSYEKKTNFHPQCAEEIVQQAHQQSIEQSHQQNIQHTPQQSLQKEKLEIQPSDRMNGSAQHQELIESKEANKQNETVQFSQNPQQSNHQQQSKVSYFIGDDGEDEDQISDSEEVIQSSSSSEQQDDQQQLEDEIEDQEDQQQQMLQLDQDELQEQDSDEQEESQDDYPDDYDETQETKFDKLLYSTSAQFKNQTTEQQFLARYKSLKQALQAEQHSIKQEQMVFGLVSLPFELQMKKMRINQGYLNLINKNYLIHLELEGGKRTSHASQNSKQDELQSTSEYQTQACKIKPAKRVAFKQDIQMKIFKDTQQVSALQKTQELTQMMNTADKAPNIRRFTMNVPPSPKPPSVQNKTPLQFSSQVIARFEEQLSKIDKQTSQQQLKQEQKIDQSSQQPKNISSPVTQQIVAHQLEKKEIVSELSQYENKENQIFVQTGQKQVTQAANPCSQSENQSYLISGICQAGQHATLVQ